MLTALARAVQPSSRPVLTGVTAASPAGAGTRCSRTCAVAASAVATGSRYGVSANRSLCAATDHAVFTAYAPASGHPVRRLIGSPRPPGRHCPMVDAAHPAKIGAHTAKA
jgi:hypothetical protein